MAYPRFGMERFHTPSMRKRFLFIPECYLDCDKLYCPLVPKSIKDPRKSTTTGSVRPIYTLVVQQIVTSQLHVVKQANKGVSGHFDMLALFLCDNDVSPSVVFDIYYNLYQELRSEFKAQYHDRYPSQLKPMFNDICCFPTKFKLFKTFLSLPHKRTHLLKMLQFSLDYHNLFSSEQNKLLHDDKLMESGHRLVCPLRKLCSEFQFYIYEQKSCFDDVNRYHELLHSCIQFGCLIYEAGWYSYAMEIFNFVNDHVVHHGEIHLAFPSMRLRQVIRPMCAFEFLCRFAFVSLLCGEYPKCDDLLTSAEAILHPKRDAPKFSLHPRGNQVCALYYLAKSFHCFMFSDYSKSLGMIITAMSFINDKSNPHLVADVMRLATKICVLKRNFKLSAYMARFAISFISRLFGEEDLKYAEVLSEFGFHLLHLDFVASAVKVHRRVLEIRRDIVFRSDRNNLVSVAHMDLGYALYVQEYNTGNFSEAYLHGCIGLHTLQSLVQGTHYLQSSAQRVIALIIEEQALELPDYRDVLLADAEKLHKQSLKITVNTLGQRNLQTAKHYGNLGRLYQSMAAYEEAEEMHKKAIEVKRMLMGSKDYEVALSLGHLASLYNYDMKIYDKAEQLYLEAIEIGETMFGYGYSGLEYDYRGLQRLYRETRQYDKVREFEVKLRRWQLLHEEQKSLDRVKGLGEGLLDGSEVEKDVGCSVLCLTVSRVAHHFAAHLPPVSELFDPDEEAGLKHSTSQHNASVDVNRERRYVANR